MFCDGRTTRFSISAVRISLSYYVSTGDGQLYLQALQRTSRDLTELKHGRGATTLMNEKKTMQRTLMTTVGLVHFATSAAQQAHASRPLYSKEASWHKAVMG